MPARRLALAAAVVAAVAVVAVALFAWPPDVARLAAAARAGPGGALAFAAAYVALVPLLAPTWLLSGASGFAFGPIAGGALAVFGQCVGGALAFALGRGALREQAERRMTGHPLVTALDESLHRRGLAIVFLLRLSPVFPFGPFHYLLGASRVRTRDYLVGASLGVIPSTLVFAWAGSLARSASDLRPALPAGAFGRALLGAGLAAALGAMALATREARRVLREGGA